jgi:DNA mismatch repair protein MutS
MSHKVTDEYFEYFKTYTEEYGEKTCVLMQVGSFYEINMVKNETEVVGNLTDIAAILNIQVTKKNKNSIKVDRSNPYMAGFPKPAINKFMPLLFDAGYTVVLVDQTDDHGKIKRKVSGVYSPSIQPFDNAFLKDDNTLVSIILETLVCCEGKITLGCSISTINLSTNQLSLCELWVEDKNMNETIDQFLDQVAGKYKGRKEVVIHVIDMCKTLPFQFEKEYLIKYLDLFGTTVHVYYINEKNKEILYKYKRYSDLTYQNQYLRQVYANMDFGLLEPVEHFDLSHHQLSVVNMMFAIDFVSKHDATYVQNLSAPTFMCDDEYMLLELNTASQLNLLPSNQKFNVCLFDIINKTSTAIGRRGLKSLLCKPFKDTASIRHRQSVSNDIDGAKCKARVERIMRETCDFERLHRKLSLGALHPHELCDLYETYCKIKELYLTLEDEQVCQSILLQSTLAALQDIITSITDTFDTSLLRKFNLDESNVTIENFFIGESGRDFVSLEENVKCIEDQIEKMRYNLESLINPAHRGEGWIKTAHTESDGYYFTCTKIRGVLLQKADKREGVLTIKFNTANSCKISCSELDALSIQLTRQRTRYAQRIKESYKETTIEMYKKYHSHFQAFKDFIEVVDICMSNVKCKEKYKYTMPTVHDTDDSFIDVKGLRHPIIERVNDKLKYVTNDIHLNDCQQGVVLYALNSCGKSSLLRSIGICVVMAQCGLYVPCSDMNFSPFKRIISQVDMVDNLWRGQSSFVGEMVGLRKIINVSDKNTLVLVDELSKGSEVLSATSIFAATVLRLADLRAKFICTTHLHDLVKVTQVHKHKNISVMHLSVNVTADGDIVFERKLKPGPCDSLYGIEVAKATGLDSDMIETAFAIRDELTNRKKVILRASKSRYNSKKLVDKCEICGVSPRLPTELPLDTHHINFQCTADKNDFIGHFHKNTLANLVVLCKECHIQVHKGSIVVRDYKQTSKGIVLDYTR